MCAAATLGRGGAGLLCLREVACVDRHRLAFRVCRLGCAGGFFGSKVFVEGQGEGEEFGVLGVGRMHLFYVDFRVFQQGIVDFFHVVEQEAARGGVGGDGGLGEAEVLVVVQDFLVDGRGVVGDRRSGDVLGLKVFEAKEAAVHFVGCGGGQLGAVGRDELDADVVQVEGGVAVVANEEADGEKAVAGVVEPEEVGLAAGFERLGGDGDLFLVVGVARGDGRDLGRGWGLSGGGEACGRTAEQKSAGERGGLDARERHTHSWTIRETARLMRTPGFEFCCRCMAGYSEVCRAGMPRNGRRRLMMAVYSLGLVLALALSAPVWGWRMVRQGRYRQGLRERLGAVPARLRAFVQGGEVIWVHAVSVGEAVAAAGLIRLLEEALPAYRIVLSTTTPTGQRVAREGFGADRVFFFPLDFAFAVRAYLRVLRPRMVVLMESEIWPRMLVECERVGVTVAVVNARVSDRSLPRYLALRGLWRPLLAKVRLLLAQSEEDAQRWVRIGALAGCVRSVGNLKHDVRIAPETPLAALLRRHLPAGVPVLVCGSTHEGEEALLLDCWGGSLAEGRVMILAPRHPERTAQVQRFAESRGLVVLRLGAWRISPVAIAPGTVLVVDTVGELAGLYALAQAAFVGGSLLPKGGHNPLEAARFGVPVVMGPHFENFRGMVDGMIERDAISILPADEVCAGLKTMLAPGFRSGLGERGREYFQAHTGASERTVEALLTLVQETQR